MNNTEYLNEGKYRKVKKVLVTIGCISLIIGISLFIASFLIKIPGMREEGWYEARKLQSMLRFLAFPFALMIPSVTFFIGFSREIQGFLAQTSMPVAQEGIDKMTPTVSKAAGTIATEVTKGIIDATEEHLENTNTDK